MSLVATNMAAELRAEEVRNASNMHIVCLTLPDKRYVTTNVDICEAFRHYFQDLFSIELGLSPARFDTYLTVFPCLNAARCEHHV